MRLRKSLKLLKKPDYWNARVLEKLEYSIHPFLVVLNTIATFVQNRNHIYDMQKLIDRNIKAFVNENLSVFPAVAILGPRQCGKSTLVKMLYQNSEAYLYLDLQNLDDLNKLREPRLFFQANQHVTICLDEIQLVPELFSVLRSEIDQNR